DSVGRGEAVARHLGYPVVVKPNQGGEGRGVTPDVRDAAELRRAYERAAAANLGVVIVEKFRPGHDHRLLVVGGRLVAASQRVPAQVVGNGADTVETLVAEVNRDPRRGLTEQDELIQIEWDDEAERMLARQ